MFSRLARKFALIAAATVLALPVGAQQVQPWMQTEIGTAWSLGYKGQKKSITVVDDFRSFDFFGGNLRGTFEFRRHGGWTALEASMIAPRASIYTHDFNSGAAVRLRSGLNTLNLSYGIFAPDGYSGILWNRQEASILAYARDGRAVVVKAAGNEGVAVGTPTADGDLDYLARDLIGKKSAIFVGALNTHGTEANPATMASYSNTAGTNPTVQNQFLVVGVTGDLTGLYGTSFAAPIISGYSAVLGSKFTRATPTQITNQLLSTARTDTVLNYDAAVYGRGEACITCALAPRAIK